jgi:hypothetical protein
MITECTNLNINTIPILNHNQILPDTVQDLIEVADGKSAINPERNREGIVLRLNKPGPKVSFKSVSNTYLLR